MFPDPSDTGSTMVGAVGHWPMETAVRTSLESKLSDLHRKREQLEACNAKELSALEQEIRLLELEKVRCDAETKLRACLADLKPGDDPRPVLREIGAWLNGL